jgi:thioesterase domain-containing protein
MQPTQQQLQMALEHAQELGLISSDVEVTQIEHIFNVFKANRQALLNYTPSIYPEKIVFIRALEATNSSVEHPAQTWGRFSLQPLKIRDTPGNHYTMFSSLAVEELAKLISQEIEKA